MKPTIGRIVHYILSASDVETIQAGRVEYDHVSRSHQPPQESRGNEPACGDVVPMIIVRVTPEDKPFPAAWNGQVFLDGSDSLWVTNVTESEKPEPGHWTWPPRD